jgi:hypothetical protein
MPRYYFNLAGQLSVQDTVGHECVNDAEANDHASFIAHRIGTEKPEMVQEGNYISVRNDEDEDLCRVPLASTLI